MIEIIPLCALKDNYIWIILNKKNDQVCLVDPGEAEPVFKFLNENGFKLKGILITHHHGDHSAGVADLLKRYEDVAVFASDNSELAWVTQHLKDNEAFSCLDFTFRPISIPGHTLDHMAYLMEDKLFSGDTLFSAGCGRIFEGNPKMMYESLNKILTLNDETKIYCGHEYTLSNLKFAQLVEPNNRYVNEKILAVTHLIEEKKSSLPSTLKEEKLINPFLRCHEDSIIQAVERYVKKKLNSPVEVFQYLREWKNQLI